MLIPLVSGPVSAHHAFAAFDFSRPSTLHGTVHAFEWANPHVWLWVTSDEADSKGSTFAFEAPSINELTRFDGWNKHVLNVGDKVTVVYAPLRNGKQGGSLRKITLADGRVLFGGREPAKAATSTTGAAQPAQGQHP
jgi:hypothetical protein